MPRMLSLAALQALFAQETDEIFLVCLTLEHSSFLAPIRVVYNNERVERASGVYHPALFDVSLPEESPDQVPKVTLTIDNVDRSITDAVRTISGRVKVTMEVVLASNPDAVEAGPFEFYLLSCVYDSDKVSGTLGFEDDALNTAFPKDTYTPSNSPGIFR